MIQSTVLRGREMSSPTMFSIMRATVDSPGSQVLGAGRAVPLVGPLGRPLGWGL
jgi:hypothetical protein